MHSDIIAILAATAAAAPCVWFCLDRWGGPEYRSWAVPAGVAMLCGGTGYALYLPGWITASVFLAAMLLLHKKARQRQQDAVTKVYQVRVPDGPLISLIPLKKKHPQEQLGAWVVSAEPPAKPLELRLDFLGESEGDHQVVLQGTVPAARPGFFVCHHPDARGEPRGLLAEQEPVTDISGLTPDTVVRATPLDLAFDLCDIGTLSVLNRILALRGAQREVHVVVSGPQVRIVATRVLDRAELRRLLPEAARLLLRVQDVGGLYSQP